MTELNRNLISKHLRQYDATLPEPLVNSFPSSPLEVTTSEALHAPCADVSVFRWKLINRQSVDISN